MKFRLLTFMLVLYSGACATRSDPASIEWLIFAVAAQPKSEQPHLTSAVVIAAAVGLREYATTKIWPGSSDAVIEKIATMSPEPWVIDKVRGLDFSVVEQIWHISDKASHALLVTVDRNGGIRIPLDSPIMRERAPVPAGTQPPASGNQTGKSIGGVVLSEFISALGNSLAP